MTAVRAGDRVIVPFQVSCGECEWCRRGLHSPSCATAGAGAALRMAPIARQEWGGALSDCVRVPYADAMLVALPPGLDPAAMASVSDNVPDGWRGGASISKRWPGAPVLVVGGAGDVSCTRSRWPSRSGWAASKSTTSTPTRRRLDVAERLGANAIERPVDGTRLGRYPITVDHSSEAAGLRSALLSTEPEGTCTATAIYFAAETAASLLQRWRCTRGVVFRTGRGQRPHRASRACWSSIAPGPAPAWSCRPAHRCVERRFRRLRCARREDGDRPLACFAQPSCSWSERGRRRARVCSASASSRVPSGVVRRHMNACGRVPGMHGERDVLAHALQLRFERACAGFPVRKKSSCSAHVLAHRRLELLTSRASSSPCGKP